MYQSKTKNIVQEQIQFFNTGKTKDVSFRIKQLKILKKQFEIMN